MFLKVANEPVRHEQGRSAKTDSSRAVQGGVIVARPWRYGDRQIMRWETVVLQDKCVIGTDVTQASASPMANYGRRRHVLSFFMFMVPVAMAISLYAGQEARSAPIAPDDMFFAPLTLEAAVYPIQPMTGDGDTSPFTAVWTEADILDIDPGRGDITITGVELLPVLLANPSAGSEEGEYTDDELGAIDVTNYMDFYKQKPGTDIMDPETDYTADLTSNVLTVQFGAPGVYVVRVKTTSRACEPTCSGDLEDRDYVYSQFVNDFLGEDGERDAISVHREYGPPLLGVVAGIPQKDLYIVSSNDPNDNGFNANALEVLQKRGKTVETASTLQEAINKIGTASTNAGTKITVTMIGHGRPGSIKIGTERINKDMDSNMSGSQFGEAVRDSVSELTFFSCNTRQGANGQAFMQNVANGLGGTSYAWPVTVTAAGNMNLFGFKIRDGYFNTDARGKKGSDSPPPGGVPAMSEWGKVALTLVLLTAGTIVLRRRAVMG